MCQERSRKMFSHRCDCSVKLVQACLSAGKARQKNFHHSGGPVKLVQSCLSASKDRESSFHHCGGPKKLVLACLSEGKVRESEAREILFKCQQRQRKQFSPLWRSCEALSDLLKCGEGPKM